MVAATQSRVRSLALQTSCMPDSQQPGPVSRHGPCGNIWPSGPDLGPLSLLQAISAATVMVACLLNLPSSLVERLLTYAWSSLNEGAR